MKRMATDVDRLVTAMGGEVLKCRRDALAAHPPFVLYADNPGIIDMDLFENLNQVPCCCHCVMFVFVS